MFVPSISVLADAAPPDPPHGANPDTTVVTNVRMASETVVMDIGMPGADEPWAAVVTADFTMRNMGEAVEDLDVRFPLDYTLFLGGQECENPEPDFPSITDIRVWVNGQAVPVRTEYVSVKRLSDGQRMDVPCWAHFQVHFPPGKDVALRVVYTTLPYEIHYYPIVEYAYILKTGSGWFGTIGSADIIFRMPYAITDENFYGCSPEDCQRSTYEVRWHREDFEPDFDVSMAILHPDVWQMLVASREQIAANPDDGNAWGRLGRAYKEIALDRKHDIVNDHDAYQRSKDAYEHALALLPDDVDWHYGIAELLCAKARTDYYDSGVAIADVFAEFQACVAQLKFVLDARPDDAQALEWLQWTNATTACSDHAIGERACWDTVDLSGTRPDYLILTPQTPPADLPPDTTPIPEVTIVSTSTPTPRAASPSPEAGTSPVVTPSAGVTSTAGFAPSPTGAPESPENASAGGLLPALGIAIVLGGAGFIVWRLTRNNLK
ncbi:MAG: hypothetical protein Fur0018_06990 [Anaerolineales bacterium]